MARQKSIPLANALALGQPLTLLQCSEFLQVSVRSVHRLVAQGLPVFLVGPRSPRFDIKAVQSWLETKLPVLVTQSGGLHPKESRHLH